MHFVTVVISICCCYHISGIYSCCGVCWTAGNCTGRTIGSAESTSVNWMEHSKRP